MPRRTFRKKRSKRTPRKRRGRGRDSLRGRTGVRTERGSAPHTSFSIARQSSQPLIIHPTRQHSTASRRRQDAENHRRQRRTALERRNRLHPDNLEGRTGVHPFGDRVHPLAYSNRHAPPPHMPSSRLLNDNQRTLNYPPTVPLVPRVHHPSKSAQKKR